jgi:hypothetical protein
MKVQCIACTSAEVRVVLCCRDAGLMPSQLVRGLNWAPDSEDNGDEEVQLSVVAEDADDVAEALLQLTKLSCLHIQQKIITHELNYRASMSSKKRLHAAHTAAMQNSKNLGNYGARNRT